MKKVLGTKMAATAKVDKERYSTPALGGKLRGGGTLQMDDVTNILTLQVFTASIQYN